jgi:hypothetical protein
VLFAAKQHTVQGTDLLTTSTTSSGKNCITQQIQQVSKTCNNKVNDRMTWRKKDGVQGFLLGLMVTALDHGRRNFHPFFHHDEMSDAALYSAASRTTVMMNGVQSEYMK